MSRKYDLGWIAGSQAQHDADEEHVIKPLLEEVKDLRRFIAIQCMTNCGHETEDRNKHEKEYMELRQKYRIAS